MIKLQLDYIKNLIDEPYLSRGHDYFLKELVHLDSVSDQSITAKVASNSIYFVKLFLKKNGLRGQCSCPAFEDFGPCKYMAAAAFATIASKEGHYRSSSSCKEMIEEMDQFEKLLSKKTKNELISLIKEVSNYYPEIIYEIMDREEE